MALYKKTPRGVEENCICSRYCYL